ncbi:MAG: DMT family transporter [Sedimentisphaerales bacterium]|nr:DMT family transporter [Sedimentisphaerales bacterium]
MQEQKRAYLYTLMAVLFWATAASAFKISLIYMETLSLLFFASFASTAVLFFYLVYSNKLSLLKTFSKKDYLHSAFLGFLNPFLYYIILLKAYSILPAQMAQPINFFWPITLVLLSIPILKQKIYTKDILSIFISFIGVVIISTRGTFNGIESTELLGVIYALFSTIIWSLFWIYNTKDKHDEVIRIFLNFFFGLVFISPVMLIFTKNPIPKIQGLLGAVYIGLFEMGITFILWLKALKSSKSTVHVANLIFIVPFLSLVIINFAVGEMIHLSTIIGSIFIVCGIILQKVNIFRS